MLKTAYRVMKQRDPAAVIHLAGLTWWHDPTFLDRLLAIAAADPQAVENNYFFDVVSLHIYFRTETIRSIIEQVVAIQDRYGLQKPIWINETNAPPNRDPEWPVNRPRFQIDLDQQTWFVIQAVALGFASGAERISVYKLVDINLPPGGESFGLVRPDLSRRPAYDAFKLVTRCFGAFDEVALEVDPSFYRITFSRPGTWTHVAWSRTPAESNVQIRANREVATLLDTSGESMQLLPQEGNFTVRLSGQRCGDECLVGGQPRLLLETSGNETYSQTCLDFHKADAGLVSNSTVTATATPATMAQPRQTAAVPTKMAMVEVSTPAPVSGSGPSGAASDSDEAPPNVVPPAQSPARIEPTAAASARAPTDATLSSDENVDAASGGGIGASIGLWFLGLGGVMALAMMFYMLRSRIDQDA
jgi:hypothetical protein